jgi:aconitate hydratase
VARGLRVAPHIKTSLAPGSRVVTDYLGRPASSRWKPWASRGGLRLHHLHRQRRPLAPELEGVVTGHDLICASVLSGNRNFEARIHPPSRPTS